ncbi:MAG: ATP synthase F1 subunit delta [Eubacteriales bacterium]
MSLVGKKYATALMGVAKDHCQLDEIYNDFKIIVNALDENKQMWTLMNTPSLQTQLKKDILKAITGEAFNSFLYNFFMILLEKHRFLELKFIFLSFKESYLAEKNTMEATVVSVIELKQEFKERLQKQLEAKYKKSIVLQTEVDPSILGGLIVYVGDQVIDGSMRRKLNNMKNNLKEIRLQQLGVS